MGKKIKLAVMLKLLLICNTIFFILDLTISCMSLYFLPAKKIIHRKAIFWDRIVGRQNPELEQVVTSNMSLLNSRYGMRYEISGMDKTVIFVSLWSTCSDSNLLFPIKFPSSGQVSNPFYLRLKLISVITEMIEL